MPSGDGGAQRVQPAAVRLIAITDSLRDGVEGLTARAAAAVAGGATMVQLRLRDETARTLAEVARALRSAIPHAPLVVNDRADVALAVGAQGVHVGSDGMSPSALRRIVPHDFIIGVSIADDDQVVRAVDADYVGIGPVYSTAGQTGGGTAAAAIGAARFAELAAGCAVPAVAIGGITPENVADVMRAGAAGVAVISALFGASDPASAARVMRHAQDASER
jgi:thiamine-phosphate pyrophosphorylase